MATSRVYANWNPEEQFVLTDRDAYPVAMKKPGGVTGSDLLPMSLIGCLSYDVIVILKKQRQDLRELNVTAESTQDDDPPWRFRKIHIHYRVIGRGIDPKKVGKAIQLSGEKYCSVYATLRDALEITYDFEIVEG